MRSFWEGFDEGSMGRMGDMGGMGGMGGMGDMGGNYLVSDFIWG